MAKAIAGTILALMKALGLFQGRSWDAWRAVLKAIFFLPMSAADLELFCRVTGRTRAPEHPFREVWLFVGRRGGKTIIAALIVVFQTTCRVFKLAAGEIGVFMVICPDRRQGRVLKGYVAGMLRAIGALESMVESETSDSITLRNGLRIEIVTASFRTLRGYTCIGAVVDEIAFLMSDDSANPDSEILAALRPAMATQPDAILVCITSPYARRGETWKAYQRHFRKDESPVLVVQADSQTMNPEVPQDVIDAAYEDDPASAAAEYGAEFRKDVETFISKDAIEAVRVPGRFELARKSGVSYAAFADPAGGSGADSFTLAIAHVEKDSVILDAVRERKPPFSPDDVSREYAELLRDYGLREVWGDHFGGDWPKDRLAAHGIRYHVADETKSELYRRFLPLLNSQRIELLDDDQTIKQFERLERRATRGGREIIDHPPKGHDDRANVVAGVMVKAAKPRPVTIGCARIERLL